MSTMHEHHAQARCSTAPKPHAAAHATDGRTDVLTQKHSTKREIFRIATRAISAKRISESGSGQNPARLPDSGKVTSPTSLPGQPRTASQTLDAVDVLGGGPRGGGVSRSKKNAQGFSARPQLRNIAACTNTASRRVQAWTTDARRHQSTSRRVGCSPVARWHGRSHGSDPLRPPAYSSAAGRIESSTTVPAPPILVSFPAASRAMSHPLRCEIPTEEPAS